MTQEEKRLLLLDLCARLPYGVNVQMSAKEFDSKVHEYSVELNTEILQIMTDEKDIVYLPYLRPMNCMTKEEAEQIIKFICEDSIGIDEIAVKQDYISAKVDYLIGGSETITIWFDDIIQSIEIFDFLNAHHFDYRGLIAKGLALAAPEGMYN